MKKLMLGLLLLSGISLFVNSCSKNKQAARLNIYLTDDPAAYDEVNIDIQQVFINKGENGSDSWKEIPITPGVYNLLEFRNGFDTLLGSIELPAGKISQIRLVLGNNNSLKEGAVIHKLETPSAQQSGLKLNVQTELTEGITYKLWIDFDAARSIVKAGNSGKYLLKPVIRTYTEALSGAIKGFVIPATSNPWVYAIRGSDTVASAKPEAATGYFLIKGLPAATYQLAIDGSNGYTDKTISDILVVNGVVTNTGTTTLTQ
jgi:hypothetical protein